MISDLDVRMAEVLTPAGDLQSAHGTGFLVPDESLMEPYPDGWWISESKSGQPSGNGFYCHTCHLLYVKGAPAKIRHCGAYETLNPKQQLVTHRLGSHVAYEPVARRSRQVLQAIEPGHADLLQPKESLFAQAKDFAVRWLR